MDKDKFTIQADASIYDAIQALNNISTLSACLYVINRQDQLVGSVTDGDIRRGLIKHVHTQDSVVDIMAKNPVCILKDEFTKARAAQILKTHKIDSIPVIDENRRIADIFFITDKDRTTIYKSQPNKVFVLAGGFGHRLEPFTKILPKPLIPLGEKPIIEIVMDNFSSYGFDKFIISLNYKAEMIKAYLADQKICCKFSDISYVMEDNPLGTAGSLSLAKDRLDDTFFIVNADTIINENYISILNFHKNNQADFTIMGCLKDTSIPYGVINVDDQNNFVSMSEKPKYRHIINSGVYVAEPEVLNYIAHNQKMDMNQLIDKLIENKKRVKIFPIIEEYWFDVGRWPEYDRVRKYFE